MQLYKHANVFWGKNYNLIENATLIINKGKVVEITKNPCDSGIDLHGAYVIPAFVNAHCHLGDTGAKELGIGLTLEEAVVYPNGLKHQYLSKISEEELIDTIRQGLLEMLHSGIAVVADYREGGQKGILALRKAAEGLPIHVIALGRPTLGNDADDKVRRMEMEQILDCADGFGMGGIYALDEAYMRMAREITGNKLFSIHIAEGRNDCENSMRQFHKSEVQRAAELDTDFMVHLTHTDENDRRLLAEKKIPIVCCPRTNLILGDGFPDLDLFTNCGISWGLGSDNMMFTSPNMFREMDAASRVIRGKKEKPDNMPYDTCLKAATYCGAKALKLEQQFGTLEVGKSASFLAIRSDSPNLKYSHNIQSSIVHRTEPAEIAYFLIDGTEVIRNGNFLYK